MKQLLWYGVDDFFVHCSAKAGSQSLMKFILKENGIEDPGFGKRRATLHYELVKEGKVKATDRPESSYRLQFVRDPKERFESLWRWGCRDRNQGIPALLWDESPDELLWYIDKHLYDNEHWCPQSVVTPYASHVRPLSLFNKYLGIEEKENRTSGEVPKYDEELLNELYLVDNLLYKHAEEQE